MRYFVGCNNEQEVKTKFRDLAKIHHPDRGGDSNEFIAIKQEYDLVLEKRSYPVHTTSFGNNDFYTRVVYSNQKESTTKLDPKEIERQKAKAYFDKKRIGDDIYVQIDVIKSLFNLNQVVILLNKMENLEEDHFKYVTFLFDKPVSLARTLYKIYLNNKMGW